MDEVYSLPVDQQIRYYLYQLASPLGMMAAIGVIVAMVMIIWLDRAKWMGLSLLIFFQTFGFIMRGNNAVINTLVQPLQQVRYIARPAAMAMLGLMLVPAFRSFRGRRWRLIHVGTIALFGFELMLAGRFIIGGAYDKGILGVLVYSVTFVVLGIGVSRWLQGPEDAHAAVKSIVGAGVLLLLCTIYQIVIDRTSAYSGDRLAGTTNNPQHLGTILALMLPSAAYLLVRPGETHGWRVTSGMFLGFGLLLLLASGSRLGILMTMVAMLLLFRVRLGRLAIVGVTVSIVAYVGLQLLGQSALAGSEHLFNTENSRALVWDRGWNTFMNNFWFGAGTDDAMVENSYISAGAEAGLMGVIVIMIMTLLILWGTVRLNRVRRALGENALLADLVIGLIVSVLFGSVFEAFLQATLTDILTMLYVFLALMALLIDPGPPVGEGSPEMMEQAAQAGGATYPWSNELAPVGGDSYHHGNGYHA